jgi:hypothetical protein
VRAPVGSANVSTSHLTRPPPLNSTYHLPPPPGTRLTTHPIPPLSLLNTCPPLTLPHTIPTYSYFSPPCSCLLSPHATHHLPPTCHLHSCSHSSSSLQSVTSPHMILLSLPDTCPFNYVTIHLSPTLPISLLDTHPHVILYVTTVLLPKMFLTSHLPRIFPGLPR